MATHPAASAGPAAEPTSIRLQAYPGGPAVRIEVGAVIQGARALAGDAAPVGGAGGAACAPPPLDAGSGDAGQESGPANNAHDGLDSPSIEPDYGGQGIDDAPLSTLSSEPFEEQPLGVAGSGGGAAEGDYAGVIERFLELSSALGITEALEQVAHDAAPGVVTAILAQLDEQFLTMQQLVDDEPVWMFDAEDNGSGNSCRDDPRYAGFYRARLTELLYPGARLSLLQYITLLLHQRQAHTMRDQCVDEMCRMQHDLVLPEGNIMPPSLYLLLQVGISVHACVGTE